MNGYYEPIIFTTTQQTVGPGSSTPLTVDVAALIV